MIEIHEIGPRDREWVRSFLLEQAGYTRVVSRGVLYQADELPGWIASLDGVRAALLNCHVSDGEMQVVTLFAAGPGQGLGSALLEAARKKARELHCGRLWLITTNDNLPAMHFYSKRGMRQVAIHHNALEISRRLKPEIPLTGIDGVPINDEIEYEFSLEQLNQTGARPEPNHG